MTRELFIALLLAYNISKECQTQSRPCYRGPGQTLPADPPAQPPHSRHPPPHLRVLLCLPPLLPPGSPAESLPRGLAGRLQTDGLLAQSAPAQLRPGQPPAEQLRPPPSPRFLPRLRPRLPPHRLSVGPGQTGSSLSRHHAGPGADWSCWSCWS